jgi:hypothetical protein
MRIGLRAAVNHYQFDKQIWVGGIVPAKPKTTPEIVRQKKGAKKNA